MIGFDKKNVKKHIDIKKPFAFNAFTSVLNSAIEKNLTDYHSCVILACIGTDRATGDSLGPLIGYKLTAMKHRGIHIYGTLEEPLHAKNLNEVINKIHSLHKNPFIIAIDACLGNSGNIGVITIGDGPLKPGSGVNKVLPEIGNIHITGIVNSGGFMELLTLQSTRLSIVMQMADLISSGIRFVFWKLQDKNLPQLKSTHNIELAHQALLN